MNIVPTLRGFALVLATSLSLWTGGFFGYVERVASFTTPALDAGLPPTQAIVVLTGGSERMATGLQLLRAGKGEKLFISGVYPGVGTGRLVSGVDIPKDMRDCCIVLGHAADNTRGNADETLSFMMGEGYHTLRLVTAHYHMPRSLLLFRALLPPAITVVPYPVDPDSVSLKDWWRRTGTASLLFMEYNKYLYARLCIAFGVI